MQNDRLATITRLSSGAHDPGPDHCLLEAVAYVAGEEWTDNPECVCPVLAAFGRALNDYMPDDQRQRLIAYIPNLIGTRSGPEVEQKRASLVADAAVRVFAPLALRAVGLPAQAEALEQFDEIVDKESANAAANAAAWAAARAARAAAWDKALETFDRAIETGQERVRCLTPT